MAMCYIIYMLVKIVWTHSLHILIFLLFFWLSLLIGESPFSGMFGKTNSLSSFPYPVAVDTEGFPDPRRFEGFFLLANK